MAKFFIFLLPLFLSFKLNAQNKDVDSLIKSLSNNQIYGTCNYVWVVKVESEAADALVHLGKSISQKLVELLDNPEKGIISHFVLSKIWCGNFNIETSFDKSRNKGDINYNYNGLVFYEKNGKMIAEKEALSKNKERWIDEISILRNPHNKEY